MNDVNISSQLDHGSIIISGTVPSFSKREEIVKSYAKIRGVKNVVDAIDVVLPPITEKIYFKKAKWKLNDLQKQILQNIIQKYNLINLSQRQDIGLDITAYADGKGKKEINEEYAKKRAQSIKEFMINHAVKESFITTHAFPFPPKKYLTNSDANKSRFAEFRWIYKNGK